MYIRKLAVILATLVMLVMASPAAMAAESGSTWDQVKAAGSDLWGTVKEKAPGAWETTKNKASELYGKAKEKAPEVKEKVKTGVNNAQEKISDYREDEEEEFWQWFDNQTGGTTSATPGTDDHPNPNGNPEYEPNPNQEPEYEPGPDSTTCGTVAGDNAEQSAPCVNPPAVAGGPGDIPKETLDQYTQDEIFYHDPDGNESKPASEEIPEAIVLNGKVYQYTTGAPVQDLEYEEIVIDGKTYRHYLDEEVQSEESEHNKWSDFLIVLAYLFGGGLATSLIFVFIGWMLRKRRADTK